MRAAELVTLAGAHGVRLGPAARQRSPRSPTAVTARGRESHVTRTPLWSHADLGQAAHGIPQLPWLAALYSFQRDRTVYWPLWEGLLLEAVHLRGRWSWPAQVKHLDGRPRFYLAELAELVLDEDAHLAYFQAAPALYAICLGVSAETWGQYLEERFQRLKFIYTGWLQTAEVAIQSMISEEDQVSP